MKNPRIILASSSITRKKLLENIGVKFQVIPSNYVEDNNLHKSPSHLVKKLSLGKALEVAQRYPSDIVIGADTIVYLSGQKLGKPSSKKEAAKMLQQMSDQTVKVYSGFTIVCKKLNRIITDYDLALVKMKKITKSEIENYLQTDEPLQAAGALIIEKKGGLFVEKTSGDYNAIMGLPLFKLSQTLKKFNFNIV